MFVPTTTAIDPVTHTIRFVRIFDAQADAVFDAWTKPERVTAWWDPDGVPLVACTIDLRVGGGFAFVNAGHGPPFTGTYREIDRPATLVFEAMGAIGTVSRVGVGAMTTMTVSIVRASTDHLEMFLKLGVESGTARTLDNLGHYLAP
jgi:uncharacterized protein YndB with AHSA1/START domain